MALRAIKIVEEVLQADLDATYARMDRMVEEHRKRLRVAREALKGRTDLKPYFSTADEASRYLDSCPLVPAEEGDWHNMPLALFQKHQRLSMQASHTIGLMRKLTSRIEKECIEMCPACSGEQGEHADFCDEPTRALMEAGPEELGEAAVNEASKS